MTEKDIAELFERFNVQYFGDRLPPHEVRLVPTIPGADATVSGMVERARRILWLRDREDAAALVSALLHEMVHALLGPGHTDHYFDELKRLALMGAPLVGDDDVSRMSFETWGAKLDAKAGGRRKPVNF